MKKWLALFIFLFFAQEGFSQGKTVDYYLEKAIRYEERALYEKAQLLYTLVLSVEDSRAEAYAGRARCAYKLEEFEEGLKDAEKCVSLDPNNPEYLQLRGDLRKKTGDFLGAAKDFSISLQKRVLKIKKAWF